MNRTPQQWQDFDVNRLSRPALRVALDDARADVLELVAALRATVDVCEAEAHEWDSDDVQTNKNYAQACANRIREGLGE